MTHSFDTNSYFSVIEKLYAVNQSILCKNIGQIAELPVILKIYRVYLHYLLRICMPFLHKGIISRRSVCPDPGV